MSIIEQARKRVAERYRQNYHVNAIMRGDWDTGSLVREEVSKIEAEQEQCGQRKKK